MSILGEIRDDLEKPFKARPAGANGSLETEAPDSSPRQISVGAEVWSPGTGVLGESPPQAPGPAPPPPRPPSPQAPISSPRWDANPRQQRARAHRIFLAGEPRMAVIHLHEGTHPSWGLLRGLREQQELAGLLSAHDRLQEMRGSEWTTSSCGSWGSEESNPSAPQGQVRVLTDENTPRKRFRGAPSRPGPASRTCSLGSPATRPPPAPCSWRGHSVP